MAAGMLVAIIMEIQQCMSVILAIFCLETLLSPVSLMGTATSCGRPPYVEHGSFKVTSGYKFTDHVEYTCFSDFMLNGVNFAVCLSNGSWSKPPSCLPAARKCNRKSNTPFRYFPNV
ncbi:hypothetical protein EB796_024336 [Bugula neritina]|uniref:Sushi domain-containing protein n=1 Tax=Bugula neritina TaxID=10212 RepID=A0A7J7IVD2_BUGNE|nr:hypothetical protein EB796_024336 [Bugula neritina]